MAISTKPPIILAFLPTAEPKRKPAIPPKVAMAKVTTPIMVEASQILVFKKAKLMPTAKASMPPIERRARYALAFGLAFFNS